MHSHLIIWSQHVRTSEVGIRSFRPCQSVSNSRAFSQLGAQVSWSQCFWNGQAVVKMSAEQASFCDEDGKKCCREALLTLDWHNFFILQNNSFSLVLWNGPVDLWCQIGLLGHHWLAASSLSELQSMYCMEIKCPNTHFLGMDVLTWENQMLLCWPCFILYHSFTIALYVYFWHFYILQYIV